MLKNAFDEFLYDFARCSTEDYCTLLSRYAGRTVLAEALISGLLSTSLQKRGVGRSHFHNNGFLKVALFRNPATSTSVRIHIWDPAAGDLPEESPRVHDHRWDFASIVLAGRLRFVNYEAVACPDGRWTLARLSDAASEGAKLVADQTEQCELRSVCSYEVGEGCTHEVRCDQLHSTASPTSYSASLVLTGPPAKSHSHVGFTYRNIASVLTRPALRESDMVDALKKLRSNLAYPAKIS